MLKAIRGQQKPLGARPKSGARLLKRVWLFGPTDGSATTSRTVSDIAPAGATWVDARGWGGGGGGNASYGKLGGGGAYARGGRSINPGQAVSCVISGQANDSNDGVASSASVGGAIFMSAAPGKGAGVLDGAGGALSACVGGRSAGGAGDSGASATGAAGSDAADADTLGIGGYPRRGGGTRTNDGSVDPYPRDFGIGGHYVTSLASVGPATPVTSGWIVDTPNRGGSGLVVLEYWSRKPVR